MRASVRVSWRIAAWLAAAVLVPAAVARAAACGDVSGNGAVTIADAVQLLQTVAGAPVGTCGGAGVLACGDLNGDGVVGIADVVILLNVLAGNPVLFPPCTVIDPVACTGPAGTGANGEHWNGQVTVHGLLTTSQAWPAGCRVNVDGPVFVASGAVVKIEPGALVVGVDPPTPPTSFNFSALVFLAGSKIIASGTPTQPILMQSSDHVDHGVGHVADWGGLVVNGRAPVNCPGGQCLAEGLVGVPFGGTDPNDSSGVLRYLRVEFAGREVAPDDELPAITLNGVGRGTLYDHVQANVAFDSCQKFFGGTVNAKYLVSSGCGNDLFDVQLGTQSRVQHVLGVFYQPYMENAGNEAIDSQNNENGFDLVPRTAPVFCNVTLVGTSLQPSAGLGATEVGLSLRRGTAGTFANVLAEHFRITGLELRDDATAAVACDASAQLHTTAPRLLVTHSLFFDNGFAGDGAQVAGTFTTPCTADDYWNLVAANESVVPSDPASPGPDPGVHVTYGRGVPGSQTDLAQFVPDGSEPLVTALAADCKAIDPFFDTTSYVGAFAPGGPSWLTSPWVSFELQ